MALSQIESKVMLDEPTICKAEVRKVKKEERRARKGVEKSRLYLDRLHPPAALSLGI
jgi:hypothetical protein